MGNEISNEIVSAESSGIFKRKLDKFMDEYHLELGSRITTESARSDGRTIDLES